VDSVGKGSKVTISHCQSQSPFTQGWGNRDKYYKLAFIYRVNGDGSKTAEIIKKVILPTSHCLNVNVMLSNMTFLMIFAVFDPSPLT